MCVGSFIFFIAAIHPSKHNPTTTKIQHKVKVTKIFLLEIGDAQLTMEEKTQKTQRGYSLHWHSLSADGEHAISGGTMEDHGLDNLSSFVRLTGVAVPVRLRFIGEAIVSATMSGLAIGLVCGQTGSMATPFGPLVPYLVGTWVGSGLGLMAHWKSSCAYAAMCAEHYPTILAHSLWTSRRIIVPNETAQDGSSMLKWMERGGLGRYTWCVLAATGCRSDIEEMERTKRQALMDKINETNGLSE